LISFVIQNVDALISLAQHKKDLAAMVKVVSKKEQENLLLCKGKI